MALPSKIPAAPSETTRLIAQLEALGHDCTPRERWVKELAISLATRMRSRVGADVYQALAYSLSGFPTHPAIALSSGGVISTPKLSVTTWTAESVSELTALMGDLLAESCHLCSGLPYPRCATPFLVAGWLQTNGQAYAWFTST
jgi:hypothetical protein